MSNKETQTKAILDHLMKNGSITSMESFELYGCTRLSARIFDLRKKGYDIETHMIAGKTRYGTSCEYAKYVLKRIEEDE